MTRERRDAGSQATLTRNFDIDDGVRMGACIDIAKTKNLGETISKKCRRRKRIKTFSRPFFYLRSDCKNPPLIRGFMSATGPSEEDDDDDDDASATVPVGTYWLQTLCTVLLLLLH